jgi:hypothetical protein
VLLIWWRYRVGVSGSRPTAGAWRVIVAVVSRIADIVTNIVGYDMTPPQNNRAKVVLNLCSFVGGVGQAEAVAILKGTWGHPPRLHYAPLDTLESVT